MTAAADFIVIGGGIAGVSAAAALGADADVIVLEAEAAPGYHATGRSAAIYIRNYGNTILRALNAAAHPFLCEPSGVSDESLLSPRGQLLIAAPGEEDMLAAYLEGAEGMQRIAVDDALEMVPLLDRARVSEVGHEADASDIDVDRFLQGLLRQLRARGGRVVTNAGAQAIAREGGVWRVTTPAGAFEAPVLINAAGAWADEVAGLAGVARIGVQPYRRSAAILPAPDGADVTTWPLFVSASESWYAKPEAGKLMVSPADEDPVDPHDAWADDMVLAEGLYRFEQAVTFPVTRVESSWAGLRSFVVDRTPVCGFDPEADGFFWLAGQGGYGVQTAPALAGLTADLCSGASPDLPSDIVAALSPARFRGN